MFNAVSRILLVSSLAVLAACSSAPKKPAVMSEKEYYEGAQKSLNAGNFSSAADQLEQLESHYPVGAYTEQSQLELIYAKFKHVDFDGASAAADRFIRLHPAHAQVDYAYYLRGLSNYEAGRDSFTRYLPVDSAHRDLGSSRQAYNDFRDLVSRFPASEYAPDARQRMIYLRNQLAEAEMHAARYYMKRGAYVAALNRARWVVENFQGAPVVPEALAVEVWCYERLGMNDLAQQNLALLKSNYPDYKGVDKLGKVVFNVPGQDRSWLNILTFGLIGEGGR